MKMVPVDSTAFKSIGYDKKTKTLCLHFHKHVYHYFNVPNCIYEAFLLAPSKGKFFHLMIRGEYYYTRVEKQKESLESRDST